MTEEPSYMIFKGTIDRDTALKMSEGFRVTFNLRWNNGVLEQMLQGSQGTQEWKPVPHV